MDAASVTASFTSQYRAALAMLRNAITAFPPELWDDPAHLNRTWRIAYHALYFTDLYMSPTEESFTPWEHAIDKAHWLRAPIDPIDGTAVMPTNSLEQLLAYCDAIDASVGERLASENYDAESGFSWISLNRFELHVYNIRHTQHHAAQLIERLRAHTGSGVDWIGRAKPRETETA